MLFEQILFGLTFVCLVTIVVCRWVFPSLGQRSDVPWYLDWARSLFPVFAIVFLLRGFVAEPFRIPSGSMLPTLQIGDFILVNKFTYGLRLPIVYTQVLEINEPERGDIVVFRYPVDNQTSYIKRLVGLPGDQVDVIGRSLFVNGEQVSTEEAGEYTPVADSVHEQKVQYLPRQEGFAKFSPIFSQRSVFNLQRRSFTVPEGHYFMMGDNRDNSADSRVWGTVPEQNIIGKAFFVWMHYDGRANGGGFNWSRLGTRISAEIVSADQGSEQGAVGAQ